MRSGRRGWPSMSGWLQSGAPGSTLSTPPSNNQLRPLTGRDNNPSRTLQVQGNGLPTLQLRRAVVRVPVLGSGPVVSADPQDRFITPSRTRRLGIPVLRATERSTVLA